MIFWNNTRVRRLMILIAAIGAVAAFFFLARASSNNSLFERYYTPLLYLNGALILALLILVGQQLVKLWRSRRAGVFGSRLAIRLTLMCSLIALLPGVLVYVSSIHFLGYSIESWFDVRVDRALKGGLNVSRSLLDTQLNDTVSKGRQLVAALRTEPLNYISELNRFAETSDVEEIALYKSDGVLLAVASPRPSLRMPGPLSSNELRALWSFTQPSLGAQLPDSMPLPLMTDTQSVTGEGVLKSTEVVDGGIRLRVILPVVNESNPTVPLRFVQLVDYVPPELIADIDVLENGWRDYEEINLSRQGTKKLYTYTLTMALLITLTVALGLALMLSQRFAAPLAMLAKGTRAVAEGDFSVRQPVVGNDEMGSLTESFNAMTIQLEQAQQEREHNHRILETTRAYLENILSNLSSGVLVFDEEKRLRMVNQSASVILQTPLLDLIGVPLPEWRERNEELAAFVDILMPRLEMTESGQWHQEAMLPIHEVSRALLMHGTCIVGASVSNVIVVDDVTALVQAQRDAAWSEVARRLAHEIKNPLTPIQLSAERLAQKLSDKLGDDDRSLLTRGTQTIVSQVGAMKHMVDDFAVYARKTRASQLVEVNVNELIGEVAALYDYLRPNFRVQLPDTPIFIRGEPVRLRQVFHNLIQNAIDAQADVSHPLYAIAVSVRGSEVLIDFADNGPGFPEDIQSHAFEPYVTTKAKGTGLGLAIVKKITEEHDGHVSIANQQPRGSVISLRFPLYHSHAST
jgi:nitrogen fixation/metabolism regulation signal transduction histidine kinase